MAIRSLLSIFQNGLSHERRHFRRGALARLRAALHESLEIVRSAFANSGADDADAGRRRFAQRLCPQFAPDQDAAQREARRPLASCGGLIMGSPGAFHPIWQSVP
jgi:hypothetical protein